jgi:sortase (surface protein transpeptidase)
MLMQKARFYGSVSGINLALLLFLLLVIHPALLLKPPQSSFVAATPAIPTQPQTEKPAIAGKPVRITVESLGIDLPVDDGFYNPADNTWSLSGYHAQFAHPTPPANDKIGNTLIYGHNNKYVFGPLKKIQDGDNAKVYTDNGHVFTYKFQDAINLNPNDTSIFNYDGPPILTIQTCSGNWNEWRRLFRFTFVGVDA